MTITVTNNIIVGSAVTGSWTSTSPSSSGSVHDWIGLYAHGDLTADKTGGVSSKWWTYPPQGVSSGTFTTSDSSKHSAWVVPSSGGPYEFRYFCCDPSYTVYGVSPTFSPPTATSPAPTPSPVASTTSTYIPLSL